MLRIIYIFSAILDKFVDVLSIFMRAINPVIKTGVENRVISNIDCFLYTCGIIYYILDMLKGIYATLNCVL